MNTTRDAQVSPLHDQPSLVHLTRRRLALIQRAARVGWMERLTGQDRMVWGKETYGFLGISPGEQHPTLSAWRDCVHPDDLERVARGWRRVESGEATALDLSYRIHSASGACVGIREHLEAWRAAPDSAPWILSALTQDPAAEATSVARPTDSEPVLTEGPAEGPAEGHDQPSGPPLGPSADTNPVRDLAGGLAHEFNNLLTTILGNCHSLLETLPADAPGHRRLLQIQLAAERGSGTIQKIMAFGERQMLEAREVDLARHLRHLAPMLEELVRPPIRLVIEAPDSSPSVRVDPDALDQALVQLVQNAIDAIDGAGVITVRIRALAPSHAATLFADGVGWPPHRPDGPGVVIEVQDSGRGVADRALPRVFEPFFTTHADRPGSGLGLCVVRGFARQSDGEVALASGPDGTSVRLFLPEAVSLSGARQDARSSSPTLRHVPGTPGPDDESPLARQRILLVDDDPFVRSYVRDILEQQGHSVCDTGNPLEALSLAEQPGETFDVLITDLVMPELRGDHLAAELRRAQPHVRVLYITAYAGPSHRSRQSLASPCDGLLIKPFSPDDLEHHLRVAVRG